MYRMPQVQVYCVPRCCTAVLFARGLLNKSLFLFKRRKGLITLTIADWIAIVIGDWRLLSNQSEQSSQ